MKRLTNQQIGEIELRLTARDREILTTFQKLRYVKTGQVQRLFFPINRSPKTALSNAWLALKKLNRYGLLDHLPKQIGGAKFGSQALIWHLTEAGMRLLDLGKERAGKRQRYSPLLKPYGMPVWVVFRQVGFLVQQKINK